MTTIVEQPRYQCALGGALATINALPRTSAVIHGAPGCGSSTDMAAALGSGYWGSTYCNGRATPSTNTLEREIIFGGEERLSEQLRATFRVVDADLYAVHGLHDRYHRRRPGFCRETIPVRGPPGDRR